MRLFWLSLGWLVGLALGRALGLPAWAWLVQLGEESFNVRRSDPGEFMDTCRLQEPKELAHIGPILLAAARRQVPGRHVA
jgi:hypothetical protein